MSRYTHTITLVLFTGSIIWGAAAAMDTPTQARATTASSIPTPTSTGIGEGTPPPPPTRPTAPPRPTRTPTPPPTVLVVAASADAYVRAGTDASTCYGADPTLVVKDGSTAYDRRALLRFDLRGIAITPLRRAILKLYVTQLPNGAPAPFRGAAVASDTWNEHTITWNTQPVLGSAGMLYQVPTTGWFSLDLTGYVQTQLAGDQQVSIALFDDTLGEHMLRFSSREGAHPPVLELTR
jgi:hypothetical protein